MQDKETRLRAAIEAGFPGDKYELGGDPDHVQVRITSAQFNGLKTLEKQRLVFKKLGNLVHEIHAFQFELSPLQDK